ncbi:MAG: aspartate/glutamate racemase family protein [Hyphomicrobiaceae bacterium]
MQHVVLINPNTNAVTTSRMVEIAREAAGPGVSIAGLTARSGVPLIFTAEQLDVARHAVLALRAEIPVTCAGIIIAAFGDPALDEIRGLLPVPVTGIGEAGLLEAAQGGRRFAVVSTSPGLVAATDAKVARLGLGVTYAGTVLTPEEPVTLTADPSRLEASLAAAIERAIVDHGVEAVVIGGGPLAAAARALAPRFAIAVVEPVSAAVRALLPKLSAR